MFERPLTVCLALAVASGLLSTACPDPPRTIDAGDTDGSTERDSRSDTAADTERGDATDTQPRSDTTATDGDTGDAAWYDRPPYATAGTDRPIALALGGGDNSDGRRVAALPNTSSSKLRDLGRIAAESTEFVGRAAGWWFFKRDGRPRLLVRSPTQPTRRPHSIDISALGGNAIADIAHHPSRNETYVVSEDHPELLVVDHGPNGDTLHTVGLAAQDPDGNPDAAALHVRNQTLLVGLSRLRSAPNSQKRGRPAKLAMVDLPSRNLVSTLELPHTGVEGLTSGVGGSLLVALSGERERETSGGWMEAVTDAGIYRLARQGPRTYSVGATVLAESELGLNVSGLGRARDVGVVTGFITGDVIAAFNATTTNASAHEYQYDGSGELSTDFCTTPGRRLVGQPTRARFGRGDESLLLYENGAATNPRVPEFPFQKVDTCAIVPPAGP